MNEEFHISSKNYKESGYCLNLVMLTISCSRVYHILGEVG